MKTSIIFLTILLVASSFNFANKTSYSDDKEIFTHGWANGKFWEMMTTQEKIFFVSGIEDGLKMTHQTFCKLPEEEVFIKGFRMSDIVGEIDLLYKQRANIRIGITYAYLYVVKKMRGNTSKELDDYIVALRKFFNN